MRNIRKVITVAKINKNSPKWGREKKVRMVLVRVAILALFLATISLGSAAEAQTTNYPGRILNPSERETIGEAIDFLEKYGEIDDANNLRGLVEANSLRADDNLRGTSTGGKTSQFTDGNTGNRIVVITVNPDHIPSPASPTYFEDLLELAGILRHEKDHERFWLVRGENYSKGRAVSFRDQRICLDNNWIELEVYYADILFLLSVKDQIEDDDRNWWEKSDEIQAILDLIQWIKEMIHEKKLEKAVYCHDGQTLKQFNDKLTSELGPITPSSPSLLDEYQDRLRGEVRKRADQVAWYSSLTWPKFDALKEKESKESITPDQGGKVENEHQRTFEGQIYEYKASVQIPPNALGQSFDISVALLNDSFPQAWSNEIHFLGPVYDFTPGGLTFPVQKPAIITLPYHPNADLRAADVYRLNEIGEWERITQDKTIDYVNRTISIQTTHFSTYGIGEVRVPIPNIPTVSQWGLIIMAGAVLTVGAIVIVRRKRRVTV